MRILLTGATGFIGSYVLRRMLADAGEHEVAVLVRSRGSNLWRINPILDSATVIEGDIAHLKFAEPAIAAFEPDAVVHLAWSGVGNAARNDPKQADNVGPTLDLVHLASRVGASRFVGVGSQAEYGPTEGPIGVETPTRPTTVYGLSKLCTWMLASRLCHEYQMQFAWMRVFSTYGPMDDPAWMIPYLILKLLDRERPALTAAEQRWDYLYVADAAEAIYRAAVHPNAVGVYNLGSGQSLPLRAIIEAIRDLIDRELELGFGEVPYRLDQVMHLEADIAKLRDDLGWAPHVVLGEGLRRTVEWYREHRSGRAG